ncbi:MAG: hypothetical protein JST59_02025 [Actinobacteria bacterium]|nr:hypothetical protein [Actinomycetota bacterium]
MLSGQTSQTGQSKDKESNKESNKDRPNHKKQSYLTPKEIYNSLKQLWRNESAILEQIYGNSYGSNGMNMFFLLVVGVPPNRFRPESKVGDEKYLHDHTTILTNVIKSNRELKHMVIT